MALFREQIRIAAKTQFNLKNMKEFLMKKTRFFRYAALVLAAACALTLAGCPTDTHDPDPDPALRGNWTNNADGNLHSGLIKTFTINDNFTFTASINPTFIGAYNKAYAITYGNKIQDGADEAAAHAAGVAAGTAALNELEQQPGVTDGTTRWTVTGKLTADGGSIYIMSSLKETTDKPAPGQTQPGGANTVLVGFDGHRVKIAFANNKAAFYFASANDNYDVTAFFGGSYAIIPH
jgi:hypothetical protein